MICMKDSLQELFVDLHISGLWSDGKSISDSILLAPPEAILSAYRQEKATAEVDLLDFYGRHFSPVLTTGEAADAPADAPMAHVDQVWSKLIRPADTTDQLSSRIPVHRPYVVAGGRFQEAYYWDSYFTQLGLIRAGRLDLVVHMLDVFAGAIDRFGFVPNGFRTYFLSRSQPPFFAMMVEDYARATGDPAAVYGTYLPAIEAEYRYFTTTPRTTGGLCRYWDDGDEPRVEMYGIDLAWRDVAAGRQGFYRDLRAACESGWDFSSRWLTDPANFGTIRTTDLWPVDLNAIVLRMEEVIAEARRVTGQDPGQMLKAADLRRGLIRNRMFDGDRGYFFDTVISDGSLSPRNTAAGLFALWAGAASEDQAARSAAWVAQTLLAPGGLLTSDLASGEQWDAPNGWAPLQWIAVKGLRRYGHDELAQTIRDRWLDTCELVFRRQRKFTEKYDVVEPGRPASGGEYQSQDGFGWTNGVYLDLAME